MSGDRTCSHGRTKAEHRQDGHYSCPAKRTAPVTAPDPIRRVEPTAADRERAQMPLRHVLMGYPEAWQTETIAAALAAERSRANAALVQKLKALASGVQFVSSDRILAIIEAHR